jgi:hypothetical protein
MSDHLAQRAASLNGLPTRRSTWSTSTTTRWAPPGPSWTPRRSKARSTKPSAAPPRPATNGSHGRSSTATISIAANHTERDVAEECETLAPAGVLSVRPMDDRFSYSLAKRDEREAFVGSMPTIAPNRIAVFDIAGQLVRLGSAAETGTTRTPDVKGRTAIEELDEELDELGIDDRAPTSGPRTSGAPRDPSARRRSVSGHPAADTSHLTGAKPADPRSGVSPDCRRRGRSALGSGHHSAPATHGGRRGRWGRGGGGESSSPDPSREVRAECVSQASLPSFVPVAGSMASR